VPVRIGLKPCAPRFPSEHLLGRDIERIFLEDAADDDHRMRAHDVDHGTGIELGQVIGADHRVVLRGQRMVQARLVFDDIVHAGPVFERPFHVGDVAGNFPRRSITRINHFQQGFDHPVLVEMAILEVGFAPVAHFELPLRFGGGGVDAFLLQARQVGGAQFRVDDMEGAVAALESFHDEGHEHAVLFFLGVEKGAGMAGMGKGGTGQVHDLVFVRHGIPWNGEPAQCSGQLFF
jgi:hypothetical protein